jgi:hypothetical protein
MFVVGKIVGVYLGRAPWPNQVIKETNCFFCTVAIGFLFLFAALI